MTVSHPRKNGNVRLRTTAASPYPSLAEERPTKEAAPSWRIRCRINGGGDGVPPDGKDTWLQLWQWHNYLAWWNEEKGEVGTNSEEVKWKRGKRIKDEIWYHHLLICAEILYASYVCLFCLCFVRFLCPQVSYKIRRKNWDIFSDCTCQEYQSHEWCHQLWQYWTFQSRTHEFHGWKTQEQLYIGHKIQD